MAEKIASDGAKRARNRVQDNIRYPDEATKRACREAAALAAVPFNRYAIRSMMGRRPPSKFRLHAINELRQLGLMLKNLPVADPSVRKQVDAAVRQITAAIAELRGG